MAQTEFGRAFEFIAFWATSRVEKKRAEILPLCPAVLPLGRRSGRSPALPYPPLKLQDCITLFTLREGDISTLQNRGHFYFALTHRQILCVIVQGN